MAENIDAERAAFEAWARDTDQGYASLKGTCEPGGWYYFEDDAQAAWAAWQAGRRTPSASIGEDGLPPIEYDRGADRTYIPLPGGWEIQTKGSGSTFRIAHVQQQTRWQVLEDSLHEPLEAMARDTRSALAAKDAEIANLRVQLARQSQGVAPPVTPEEVVAFIGNHYNKMYDANDVENIIFELTVHDLQSALLWWFDDIAAPPLPSEQRAEKGDNSCGS